jgi:hypothetical protein
MKLLMSVLERGNGIATLQEFLTAGLDRELVRMAVDYGRIVRIRKGWYGVTDLTDDVVRAVRVGGRLGCVSALNFHGAIELAPGLAARTEHTLHVSVHRGAVRLRHSDAGKLGVPVREDRGTQVHWTRSVTGDRRAVSIEAALAQAARCTLLRASR